MWMRIIPVIVKVGWEIWKSRDVFKGLTRAQRKQVAKEVSDASRASTRTVVLSAKKDDRFKTPR